MRHQTEGPGKTERAVESMWPDEHEWRRGTSLRGLASRSGNLGDRRRAKGGTPGEGLQRPRSCSEKLCCVATGQDRKVFLTPRNGELTGDLGENISLGR